MRREGACGAGSGLPERSWGGDFLWSGLCGAAPAPLRGSVRPPQLGPCRRGARHLRPSSSPGTSLSTPAHAAGTGGPTGPARGVALPPLTLHGPGQRSPVPAVPAGVGSHITPCPAREARKAGLGVLIQAWPERLLIPQDGAGAEAGGSAQAGASAPRSRAVGWGNHTRREGGRPGRCTRWSLGSVLEKEVVAT